MKPRDTTLTISGDARDEVFVTLRVPSVPGPDTPASSFMMPLPADLREDLRADLVLDTRGPRLLGFELWIADTLEPFEFSSVCERFQIAGSWIEVWLGEDEVLAWEDLSLGEHVEDRMQIGLTQSDGYVACIRVSQPGVDASDYELRCDYDVREDVP